jgi:magnesium transporter
LINKLRDRESNDETKELETELNAAEEFEKPISDLKDAVAADDEELEKAKINLKSMLLNSREKELNEVIESVYAIDIAIEMEDFSDDELLRFYGRIDDEHMAAILEQMNENLQQRFVGLLGNTKVLSIFSHMSNDDITDIVGEMPIDRAKTLMNKMKSPDSAQIKSLLKYPDDSAGGIMTTEYMVINGDLSAEQTIRKIKEIGPKTEVLDMIFVLDSTKRLVGTVELREILLAKDSDILSDIMDDNPVSVTPEMDQEEVATLVSKYDLKAIAVVNRRGAMLGIITVDDIIDVLVEEQKEDIARLGGSTAGEDLHEPVKDSVRKRLPWLLVLLFLGMFVSSVVGRYEVVVATLPIAVAFQSVILDMAGNVGTQSLAITIRALTDENLPISDKVKLIFKETKVGIVNGLILGLLSFAFLGAYIYFFKAQSLFMAFTMSACIGISLFLSIIVSSIVGSGIPMLFEKIGIDPAVASGPLITTLNDLVAVVCYYSLCWVLIVDVLHVH